MKKYTSIHIIIYVSIYLCTMLYTNQSYGYLEQRYYCTIENSNRITISLQTSTGSSKCLNYIQNLNQNIITYTSQIDSAQNHITQGQFTEYRTSYIQQIQPKLLQSRVLQKQIIKSMNKFEESLFEKTMLYINYRYKGTIKNLEKYVAMREQAIINATNAGASQDLQIIIKKHSIEKRKLEILKLIMKTTNFNDFMPLYELYKQEGK